MHVAAGTGPAYWTAGCMFRFLVSSEEAGGSYTTMEITVPPGEGANPHFHPNEEEQFYVLCGELTYEVDGETIRVGSGDFVHIPRGAVHSFKNEADQAKLLATFGPGTGIERAFLDGAVLMEQDAAYGVEQVRPPDDSASHRQDANLRWL